ncbi:flagellar biosynthesis anti-sigma factor FlgM [Pantoea sp.]|uniref:flagellar biosynthesis anti-sigma factor FlgM n=1 Tax=Pantoea sp. TaxID=69393 RepID=UPI00289E16E9|nr:flagellar biosynthesis anti-sigma factor FlgM [Pantoea sp.]
MSIDLSQKTLSAASVQFQPDVALRVKSGDAERKNNASAPASGTQVKLSKLAQEIQTDSSHDIDYDRVAKIRASLDAGELTLDSNKIAGALLDDMFQFF